MPNLIISCRMLVNIWPTFEKTRWTFLPNWPELCQTSIKFAPYLQLNFTIHRPLRKPAETWKEKRITNAVRAFHAAAGARACTAFCVQARAVRCLGCFRKSQAKKSRLPAFFGELQKKPATGFFCFFSLPGSFSRITCQHSDEISSTFTKFKHFNDIFKSWRLYTAKSRKHHQTSAHFEIRAVRKCASIIKYYTIWKMLKKAY